LLDLLGAQPNPEWLQQSKQESKAAAATVHVCETVCRRTCDKTIRAFTS